MSSAATPSTSSPSVILPLQPLQSAGRCVQSLAANILSNLSFSAIVSGRAVTPAKITPPSPPSIVTLPIPLSTSLDSSSFSPYSLGPGQHQASPSSAIRDFSSSVRVDGLGLTGKGGNGGGPAFVGQVFSMLDSSGNGLMSVTTHLDIPFITKRMPKWVKKVLARFTKNEDTGPVFRFFMDLRDTVAYVKRMNVPTGMVGACRLDVAYEHFKAKPHMFQFVPNKEQVKAANKLLQKFPNKGGRTKIHGVPVFTADNLNIAIATAEGVRWYTPYFFDKNLLDNILEASIDQHFHSLIHSRRMQRRRDILDDGLASEVEENINSIFEPPEVQELMDEMGHPGVIPLSIISKAAEVQLLDVVDKVLLGNKWLRKATGIQPKFPYLVDSFEERSAACFKKMPESSSYVANPHISPHSIASDFDPCGGAHQNLPQPVDQMNFHFPFGDWFSKPWSKLQEKQSDSDSNISTQSKAPPNPLLPKITMVGVSTGEGRQMNRASLKKTMEDLTKELAQASQAAGSSNRDKDPLFVANVGEYSSITRANLAKSK